MAKVKRKTFIPIPEKIKVEFMTKMDSIAPIRENQGKMWHAHVCQVLNDFLTRSSFVPAEMKLKMTITDSKIQHAFGSKQPRGATRKFRELIACFISDGCLDYKGLLLKKYPTEYVTFLSPIELEHLPASEKQVAIRLRSAFERVSSVPERKEIKGLMEREGIEGVSRPASLESYIPRNHDPTEPEFPPKPYFRPKFPATEVVQLDIQGFDEVWLKDESSNPTGTHKDRMAWEITIRAHEYKEREGKFPVYSMISSGSAAFSIQFFFRLYKVDANLRVIVHDKTAKEIVRALRDIGCQVTLCDLTKRFLSSEEIKYLTKNNGGLDITPRDITDPYYIRFYDWMSFEILNQNPDYCFIPFGTGDLYANVLGIMGRELIKGSTHQPHDPRFQGNARIMRTCHVLGATTRNKHSRLDKLYAKYSFQNYFDYINGRRKEGLFGSLTRVLEVDEQFIDPAQKIIDDHNRSNYKKILCEPSGIAGLALFLQMQSRRKIQKNSKILIVNTGRLDLTKRPEDYTKI
jgi:threonine dehydratase